MIAQLTFLVAWLVAAGGFFLALGELVATTSMAPWTFRCGPRLTTRGLPDLSTLELSRLKGDRGTVGRLRYRKLDERTYLLADARPWSFGGAVPPLKATLHVAAGRRWLEARASLGMMLFIGGGACGWVIGAASGGVSGPGSGPIATIVKAALGLGMATLLAWLGAGMAHGALAAALAELVDFEREARRRPWMPQ